jgi:hypothetical protein
MSTWTRATLSCGEAVPVLEVVNGLWARVEAWGAASMPSLTASLAPGASEAKVEELQKELGTPLPGSFRCSLLRHDGQGDWPDLLWYRDTYRLLRVDEIIEEIPYRRRYQTEAEVEAIPLAKAATGDKIWMSLGGEDGPLRVRSHDDPHVPRVATGYLAWLEELVADLEAGRYRVGEFGGLDRTLPGKEEQERIVETLARDVAARGGSVDDVFAGLAGAFDQPEWVCRWCTSSTAIERMIAGERDAP